MKIQRKFNNTSPHSLYDLSFTLEDLLIIEYITKITQSINAEVSDTEVAA